MYLRDGQVEDAIALAERAFADEPCASTYGELCEVASGLQDWDERRSAALSADRRDLTTTCATLLPSATVTLDVRVKRVYEPATDADGYRVLVDHVWPRGVSRERARLDEWARELAPSDELRTWFGHVPERFDEFRSRYREELAAQSDELAALRTRARKGRVTIVYAARDEEHNNARVVAELLRDG